MPQAAAVLDNAARLAEFFRRAGLPALFTVHAHKNPETDGGLMARRWKKICREGTSFARVAATLAAAGDETFVKCRYNAFTNSGLEAKLRSLDINSLVVAGVMTNLCVESTVRAAFDLGFSCLVAGDASAAVSEEFHLSSLKNMAHGFAAVRMTGEILKEAEVATAVRELPNQ
jgi:nicotinamidase-related amidase